MKTQEFTKALNELKEWKPRLTKAWEGLTGRQKSEVLYQSGVTSVTVFNWIKGNNSPTMFALIQVMESINKVVKS